jgi:hypothetical protein
MQAFDLVHAASNTVEKLIEPCLLDHFSRSL